MTATDQTPTSQALEKRDQAQTPKALVAAYRNSFAAVLPSHITRPETWIRVAQGALRKGRLAAGEGGATELEVAARNNPGVFLATLLDCARLGLEPGTEQYYLTPRKVKGRLEILGIIGYQGHIELMYRAGAISSVVAEVVHAKDAFVWVPGKIDDQIPPRWQGPMERPYHEVDWDQDDRGPLRLTYAYAVMKDGATSKVVVLNRAAINRIKASAQGASGEHSPWRKHEPSMWLKSSIRQLQKWVPTSAEYRREQMRTAAAAAEQSDDLDLPAPEPEDSYPDDDVVDAEIVENGTDAEPQYAPGEEPFE